MFIVPHPVIESVGANEEEEEEEEKDEVILAVLLFAYADVTV